MKIQLWSYNYDPEPTGIAPLSTVWAAAMLERGHQVEVVAAHPHYPAPVWGTPWRARREVRNGVPVLRLPLWPGRDSTVARLRQELTYVAALSCAAPLLGRPDVIVAVSPSFPALTTAMAAARLRRVPWVLWLQDILPDAASATGLLDEGPVLRASRRLEQAAYRSARRIVVISESFAENLRAKGVPAERIVRIYNPSSRPIQTQSVRSRSIDDRLVLTMGNIGHTQNLVQVTRAFEASSALAELGARFVLAGDGVAGQDVRRAIVTDRVEVTGVIDSARLDDYLRRAAVAVVSQQYEGVDFNVPSKLMNFMGFGLPTAAAVRPDSEVARIMARSGGGWVTPSSRLGEFAEQLAHVLLDGQDRGHRGALALAFAGEHFSPAAVAAQFEAVLEEAVNGSAGESPRAG